MTATTATRTRVHGARTPLKLRMIRNMTRDGFTAAEIADSCGIAERTVYQIRKDHGWTPPPPPETFIDDIAIEQACDGHRMTLTPMETREAVRILTRRGLSGAQIATRLGVTERTVVRHRARLAEQAMA